MIVDRVTLLEYSAASGFRPEVVEKALRLLSLLSSFGKHPDLRGKFVLKGGTALNLFLSDLPRLSVDLDLNYVGAADRGAMLSDRPKVDRAVEAACRRENLEIARVPTDHAGGKWRLRYRGVVTASGNLEVDLNYMFRVPLELPTKRDSVAIGDMRATAVPVVELHELTAGKLAALLSRRASRDLFDAHALLRRDDLVPDRLRPLFVAYAGMNRKDFRTVGPEDVDFQAAELRNQLLPVLRQRVIQEVGDMDAWASRLCTECREGLWAVLPYQANEREFLDRLLDHGEIRADLLTNDTALAERISIHPLLHWKAANVRNHRSK